jgi:hypothetical protein
MSDERIVAELQNLAEEEGAPNLVPTVTSVSYTGC